MKKVIIFFEIIIITIFVLFVLEIKVNGDSNVFAGQPGSPGSGEALYESTNTFEYNTNVSNTPNNHLSSYFDVSSPLNNASPIKSGAPQITVLTHGLNGDASNWSNNEDGDFAYDSASIISRIDSELRKNNGSGANIYWAKMETNFTFKLYDLNNPQNTSGNKYTEIQTITKITDISKHIIIVFESSIPGGYNYQVYEEFNYMLSKIVYDVKLLNGGYLPKINLIGHSRGGLTNLEYVLDHPLMIGSVFSIGTPYFGSDTASTSIGEAIAGQCDGLHDITNRNIYINYYNRWATYYDTLYSNIDYHALGGYSDLNFFVDILEEDLSFFEGLDPYDTIQHVLLMLRNELFVLSLSSPIADIVDFIISFFRDNDFQENDIDCIVQIFADIKFTAIDDSAGFWEDFWSNIVHKIPIISCPFFMNDLLVDLSSQIGIDEHGNSFGEYGFNTYQKCFKSRYYINRQKKKSNNTKPAIVHNLEARDDDLINYIMSKITIGVDNSFLLDPLSNTTAKLSGYRGNIVATSFAFPEYVNGYTIVEIGSDFFHGDGDSITSISIPAHITTIDSNAFIEMENLEEVLIDYNGDLTYIGDGAFFNCGSLHRFGNMQNCLRLPIDVLHVGDYAFYGTCFNNVNINPALEEIGGYAFSNINGLYGFNVYNNPNYFSDNGIIISNDGFIVQYPNSRVISTYTIPSSVNNVDITGVAAGAFRNANYLTNINFGNIETVGNGAFSSCSGLTSIVLPNTIVEIGVSSFANCDNLTSVLLPSNLQIIGNAAFKECVSLDTIVIPYNVASIGAEAFKGCESLDSVIITRYQLPLHMLGIEAFSNCSENIQIQVPKNRTASYKNKVGWSKYKEAIIPDSNNYITLYLNDSCNFTEVDYVNEACNVIYKLVALEQNIYKISTSTSGISLKLYDGNMTLMTFSYSSMSKILNSGDTYYLSVEFSDLTMYGYINTQIKKDTNHIHTYDYIWDSNIKHRKICSCDLTSLEPHILPANAFSGGQQFAVCIRCDGLVSVGLILDGYNDALMMTPNGSLILPNGIVILEEEDIDSYFDGSLVFYNNMQAQDNDRLLDLLE